MNASRVEVRSRFDRLRIRLQGFFRRGGSSRADADDLASDVLVRLIAPGRGEAQQTDAYAFTIARNLQRDTHRRTAVRRRHEWAADTDIAPLMHPGNDAIDAERVLMGKQEAALLVEGLAELGERTRTIFLLYRLEGWSQRAIADDLGLSISTVEKNVAKAMLHLTRKMESSR